MPSRLPFCVALALTVTGMLSISGCGVRGSLEKPPSAKSEAGEATTSGKPAHKSSPLDALIR